MLVGSGCKLVFGRAKDGFDWIPESLRKRRLALGAAVLRLVLGLVVLAAGLALTLATLHPPQDAAGNIEMAALPPTQVAQRSRMLPPDATASLERKAARPPGSRAAAGYTSTNDSTKPSRSAAVVTSPWERREIIVGAETDFQSPTPATPIAVAASEGDRYDLARALQTQLRRVGCYDGAVDGDWGPASRRAMSSFTDRVNASLPVEAPDPILLTLVQRFDGQACGRGCRSGEARSPAGRCLPIAVLAHTDGQKARVASGAWATRVESRVTQVAEAAPAVAAASEPLPGRMAVNGPTAGEGLGPVPLAGPSTVATGSEEDRQPANRPARVTERSRELVGADSNRAAARQRVARKDWVRTIFDDLAARR